MPASLYDNLSRFYDRLAASERPYIAMGLQELAVQPGERAAEIGTGTGWALARLAQAGGRVCGCDLSAGMLRAARARLRREGLSAGLCRADALALPFAGASLDALFMSFTLELFAPAALEAVLDECRRTLRPGGRLGVVSLHATPRPGVMARAYGWAHRRFPRAIDCRPIPAGELLARAGFTLLSLREHSLWGLPVAVCLARR